MCIYIYIYIHKRIYIYVYIYKKYYVRPPAARLDPELTGLTGVRPAVGFYGSGREPVLDVRGLLEAECTRIGV